VEAYGRTDYCVRGPTHPFVIRLGMVCPDVSSKQWAYITACNPRSKRLSVDENRRRTSELERHLSDAGYTYFTGESVAWDGTWPPEPSFLVLDISPQEARQIGQMFDQWAIVVGGPNHPAELLWLDTGDSESTG
jgi:hypothetical protein